LNNRADQKNFCLKHAEVFKTHCMLAKRFLYGLQKSFFNNFEL
jgi:hypothetical protein